VKQWAKNTETTKEDGGTHFERVLINEAGWKALDRQIAEFLDEGNAFMRSHRAFSSRVLSGISKNRGRI
jgi:hypothetical protein